MLSIASTWPLRTFNSVQLFRYNLFVKYCPMSKKYVLVPEIALGDPVRDTLYLMETNRYIFFTKHINSDSCFFLYVPATKWPEHV